MSEPELIVPVAVHALLVNEKVRTLHPFHRYQPSFDRMLGTQLETKGRGAAEPEPFSGGKEVADDEKFEGVHVQWQLPEALTDGVMDDATGQTTYPLVPNRWLVVRYSQVGSQTKAVGWVVHSDYLHSDDDGASWDGRAVINSFVNPHATTTQVDWLGRVHKLADGSWQEPPQPRDLFLTAVGAGLPAFAAYEPYHENVFSLHDNLMDLKGPGDSYPPQAELSYLVAGWYSDPAKDILKQAPDIPGLLPPDSDGSLADIIAALGWTTAGRTATVLGNDLGAAPGHGVEHVLDADEDTYYLSQNAPTEGRGVTVDLGSVQQISAVRILLGDPEDQHLLPKVHVRTSVDNQNWPVEFQRNYEAGTPVIDYRPPEPCEARYLQLRTLEAGTEPIAVRSFQITAAPDNISRTVYSGTALGLEWNRLGDAPEDDRPANGALIDLAVGHSTGEAAATLVDRQLPATRHADLLSALYHGTLDTFDGADGERDLAETTRSAWFAGSDGGDSWQIVPRDTPGPDNAPAARRSADLTPDWLTRLNTDQATHDTALHDLTASQWRLWSLYWLRGLLPEKPEDYPVGVPADFKAQCERQLNPADGTLVTAVRAHLDAIAAVRPKLPPAATGDQDPQEAVDAWAAEQHGLPEHLQLKRLPQPSYYKPADPVLLVNGTGGGTVPLTRDADNPLPCRLSSGLLRGVRLGGTMTPPPTNPNNPGIPAQPAGCTALLKEFALLDQAARTADGSRTALHTATENPATHTEGPLAEYTAPWRQPWLPMFLQWKLNFFPTPYRDGDNHHWTFQAPEPDKGLDTHGYRWNGTGTLPADFESEGDVLNRLFRGRAYLAPTTVYVLRAQLSRYLAGHPGADRRALAALREDLEALDVLSQSLDGFNDWLLQLDGGAQVPSEGTLANLTGEQNHVPDGAGGPHQRRFQPVRAGQFFFTDLRIMDRFGRILDLVTSGEGGTWYDQYPVRTASVTPSRDLYRDVENPERFIQLPPRLLQDTRLAFAPVPAAPARVGQGTAIAGWLLANHLDQTLGLYGPAGQALGELRVITTTGDAREARYTPLPHSPYSGEDDRDFATDHPELHRFLAALLGRPDSAAAFQDLLRTIDTSLRTLVDAAADDDQLPARLIGRPVALIRADLDLQLQGPPLTDPSWSTVLNPPAPTYPDDSWAIRLGDPYDLDDGLIGYYSADLDQDVDYRRLSALQPAGTSGYIQTVDARDLALPARPAARATTRRVTLLAHPHLPVHATTDILPVHELRLDAEQVHQALAAIRASFRLNPLLATTRSPRTATSSIPGHGTNTPQAGPVERILDGRLDTWYQTGAAPRQGDTVTVDLGEVQPVTGVDLYFGEAGGGRIPPAKKLRASQDGEEWTDLAQATATQAELHWSHEGSAQPLLARYLQLELGANQYTTVIRSFQVTPQDDALVIPPLSARYGTWTWAQPQATATEALDWDERGLIPADHLAHPDDAPPTARAGYLQLNPATVQEEPAPETAARP
ncbi:discoidin domain-containing protein [Kitasatospora aureofaciens]|uniref:discoidin domain-containing protein n=1 Tax=Kitasatospora aureofaciens TaxID=1894 RepID=UPI0036F451A8